MKLLDLLVKELPKSGGWPKDAVNAIYFSHKKGTTLYDKDGMGLKNGVSFICMDIPGVQREEVTKEEFESALAASEGWIEWGGGECPVDGESIVDVKQRDNWTSEGDAAKCWKWNHVGDYADIIAYRLHKPDLNSRANDDRLEQDLNECIGHDIDMPEWNGEGLPPVGTICEALMPALDNTLFRWRTVKVVESGAPGAEKEVLAYDIENTKPAWADEFRPLRTEAEKLREKAIAELASVICGDVPDTGMATAAMYAERVYDAGYRKEVK